MVTEIAYQSGEVFWRYAVVGGYAGLAGLVIFYNFERADDKTSALRFLEAATLLMGAGFATLGSMHMGLVRTEFDGYLAMMGGLLFLAAQLLVLYVVYSAYLRVRDSGGGSR